jgi:hypothetical protein
MDGGYLVTRMSAKGSRKMGSQAAALLQVQERGSAIRPLRPGAVVGVARHYY